MEQCLTNSRGKTRQKKVWLISFPVIFWDDSLEQCLTTSRGKTRKRKLGAQIWSKWAKIGP